MICCRPNETAEGSSCHKNSWESIKMINMLIKTESVEFLMSRTFVCYDWINNVPCWTWLSFAILVSTQDSPYSRKKNCVQPLPPWRHLSRMIEGCNNGSCHECPVSNIGSCLLLPGISLNDVSLISWAVMSPWFKNTPHTWSYELQSKLQRTFPV